MRKYNNRTKKTMIILAVLFVGIIIIFSLFLKKSFDVEKTAYKISSGSIMFDEEYNMLTTNTEGILKVQWAGDYYLKYNNKDHNLGTHAVIYNTNNGDTTLYGKFYEVTKTGEVEVIKGQNNIKSSVNSRFFKLADRKYLIIDRTIQSSDSSFVTSSYLIVNLDKLGNATLLNDKTSYKTIKPTILRTSSYSFDIANEKLNFGGEDIDLKKIIGSTNEYDKDKYDLNANPNKEEDASGTGSGDGTGSGSGSGAGGGTGGDNSEGGADSSSGSGGTGNGTGDNPSGDGTGNGTGDNPSGNGTGDGSVKYTVADAVATIVAQAPEDFDTLKEIADWIANDETGTINLIERVEKAETDIEALKPLDVQRDWEQTDETAMDFIKNKPYEETADDALEMLNEMGVIEATTNEEGFVLTDENGNILTV